MRSVIGPVMLTALGRDSPSLQPPAQRSTVAAYPLSRTCRREWDGTQNWHVVTLSLRRWRIGLLGLGPATRRPDSRSRPLGLGLGRALPRRAGGRGFARKDDAQRQDFADLERVETNILRPGDFYELSPENDIHSVCTISTVTSVSLHLLGNDNGASGVTATTPPPNMSIPSAPAGSTLIAESIPDLGTPK
ncbi:MAG: hypothetical protein U0175_26925 [Caldilineaceae bacterium]